jgi:hypothetical protein
MTIVIVYRLDTNGYPTETCKGTGRNGRGKNIGTGEVIYTAESLVPVIKTAEGLVPVIKTVEGLVPVIKTVEGLVPVIKKNGVKWIIDRDPMSECKEGGWTRRYL